MYQNIKIYKSEKINLLIYFKEGIFYKMISANLLILLCIINAGHANFIMNGDFKECMVQSNQNMLKIEKCPDFDDNRRVPEVDSVNRLEGRAFLFSKHQYVLEGLGQECSMKLHHFKLSKDIFLNKYSEHTEEFKKLSRYDCLNMISNDNCNGRKMNCKNKEECFSLEERNPETDVYPIWFGSHVFTLSECKYRNILLTADSFSKNVLHNAVGSCQVNDLYCELAGSIVIWSRKLIRTCLLERILYIWDLYSHVDSNRKVDFYYSNNQSLLFTPVEEQLNYSVLRGRKFKECGDFEFIETTEGLYLSIIQDDASFQGLSKLPQSKVQMIHLQETDLRDILISHEDYSLFTLFKMNLIFACSAFLNTIRSNVNNDKTFVVINEMGYADDLIIYFDHGISYLPVCSEVKNITILKEQKTKDMCFEDIQILYKNEKSQKYRRGFMRNNGIITQFSNRISCEQSEYNEKSIFINDILIQRKKNSISLVNLNQTLKTVVRSSLWNTNELHRLFEHHSILNNGSSLFENIEGVFDQHVNEMEQSSQMINGIPVGSFENDGEVGFFGSIVKGIKNFFYSIWNMILEFIYLIFLILFIILIIYICFKCFLARLGSCKIPFL